MKPCFIPAALALFVVVTVTAHAQAWRNCVPGSIGPGGCDSIGPGGGLSIGPGGGQSIGPNGGQSTGPNGGQSIGPGGGQSIGPNGGQSLDRDRSLGLNPDTLRPYYELPSTLPKNSELQAEKRLWPGMSRSQVMSVLGRPAVYEQLGNQEAFHYCATGQTIDQFLVVTFDSDKAISSRPYQVTAAEAGATGPCVQFIRKVLQ